MLPLERKRKGLRNGFRNYAACPQLFNAFARRAANQLPGMQRVYMARYLEGMERREIAEKYGVAFSTVSRTLNRGLRRIEVQAQLLDQALGDVKSPETEK